jgi:protein phosphatase
MIHCRRKVVSTLEFTFTFMSTNAEPFRFRAYGLSDIGREREANEDAFFVSEQQGLFIVSDGMGGQQAGALASAMTVQALPLQVSAERMALDLGTLAAAPAVAIGLVRAIGFVNDMVLDKTQGHPEVKGMGATVVAALYAGDGFLALAHLGDSRAYLMRREYLERLTSDHTVAEMLFQAARISRRQMRRHLSRHTLTRHIGKEDCPAADVALLSLKLGDRILLCTDGLTGMLKDREIGNILWDTEDRETACRLLIDHANNAGGRDNITVIILDAGEPLRQHARRGRRVIVRRTVGRSLVMPQYEQKREEDMFLSM